MTNEIITAISSVGFPIAACIALFKLYRETITNFNKSIDKNTDALEDLQETLNILMEKDAKKK